MEEKGTIEKKEGRENGKRRKMEKRRKKIK